MIYKKAAGRWERPSGTQRNDGSKDGEPSHLDHTTNTDDYQELRSGNRVLGEISNGALRKHVYGSRHFMRTPPGIAWDVWAIERAKASACPITIVTDRETGRVYVADLVDFDRHGVRRNFGYGDQTILPFNYWRSDRPDDTADDPQQRLRSQAEQLALFER